MTAQPYEALVERPIPDLRLAATDGTLYAVRQHVGHRPLVLFFYIRNGTPG